MPSRLTLWIALGIIGLSTGGPTVAQRGPPPDALALEEAVQQVIQQNEPAIACVLVARGEPYQAPAPAEPGQLGKFPSSPGEEEAVKRTPTVSPAHPDFVPEQLGTGVC